MANFKIGAYTTTRNTESMAYPFVESISSVLSFVDELVVVDTSDGSDSTKKILEDLTNKNKKKLRVIDATNLFDWKAKNHGIFDGQTKALARNHCKSTFLFQFDVDEIVHEEDSHKVREFIIENDYLQNFPIVAFPVIEYWGSKGKVRMDINPWKERLSRNLPDITHGIPMTLRRRINGLDYGSPGTDSCNMISKTTGNPLAITTFMDQSIMQLQTNALKNPKALSEYETWFNQAVKKLPGVHHYSWFSIERKIRQYKVFWTDFWNSMYGIETNERENPMFPGKLWSEVSDEEIKSYAQTLENSTGGHIFHKPWDGAYVPSIHVDREHPEIMKSWLMNYH